MANLFTHYGELLIEIRGEGKSADKLRESFAHFASTNPHRDPDLVCEITRTEPEPERVLGSPEEYYGRDGDRFIIRKPTGWGFMSIDQQWKHIRLSPDIDHYLAAYIIEFEVRKRLAAEGYTLIHASGVEIDGNALVFPSWRYTGKTNTMLTLLRAGGNYLSDDRLWVGSDGTVLGYPVPVNMMLSNIEAYPTLSAMTPTEKYRLNISNFLYENLDVERSLLDKGLYFATKFYMDPDLGRELVPVDQLISEAEFVDRTELSSVVALRTTLEPPQDRISVEEISGRDALADIMAINQYEWDGRLKEYFRSYDALFPERESSKSDELDALVAREEQNLTGLFNDVPTYRGLIPRKKDWASVGIAEDIVNKFGKLRSSIEA